MGQDAAIGGAEWGTTRRRSEWPLTVSCGQATVVLDDPLAVPGLDTSRGALQLPEQDLGVLGDVAAWTWSSSAAGQRTSRVAGQARRPATGST